MGCAKQRVGQGWTATGTRVELQLTWSQWKHSFLTLIFIASEIVSLLMKETSGSSYGGRNYFACRLTVLILGHSWTRLNRKSCQSSFQNLSTATVLVSPWQPSQTFHINNLAEFGASSDHGCLSGLVTLKENFQWQIPDCSMSNPWLHSGIFSPKVLKLKIHFWQHLGSLMGFLMGFTLKVWLSFTYKIKLCNSCNCIKLHYISYMVDMGI